MATQVREYSWLDFINKSDPDRAQEEAQAVEYEFSARGLPLEPTSDTSRYEGGKRVFRANYRDRGAYAADDE